jgi:7-cyano-7-deazaguanine synthase
VCSIFGALSKNPDMRIIDALRRKAGDRGRDGGRMEEFRLPNGWFAYLGNWRATPTTEVERGPLQPYDGIVHNGMIANTSELGLQPGEIDSQVLPRIILRHTLTEFRHSIDRIVGSYAIAAVAVDTIFLACNYKPIYYWSPDGRSFYFSSMARHFDGIVPRGQRPVKMLPYSVMDLRTGDMFTLPLKMKRRALVIASSGLDSTVTAAQMIADGFDVRLLHFTYGAIATSNEVYRIPQIARALGCESDIVPLDYSHMQGDSRLFGSGTDIADGISGTEYAHEWVPARNLVMLAIATAYAEAHGYHYIALGNNLEEAGAYPDNEEEFTTLFDNLLPHATQNGYGIAVISPVGHLMKHEIVSLGLKLKAPLEHTWSCYRNGNVPCGECGPCFMRKTAFARVGAVDPALEPLAPA